MRLATVCILLFSLSGCSEALHAPGPPSQTEWRGAVKRDVFSIDEAGALGDNSSGNAISIQFPRDPPSAVKNGGSFDVLGNATTLLLEARWTCDLGPCEFYLQTGPRSGHLMNGGNQAKALQWAIPVTLPGPWVVALLPHGGPSQGIAGELRVTQFVGNVTAGFSAFSQHR